MTKTPAMPLRLLPTRLDNEDFRGRAAALWLFGLFLGLRAVMGVNGALNTRRIATGDGIQLDGLGEGGADTVLHLFRLLSLAQLPLVAIGAVALWRWRAMVPFLYLVFLADQLLGRLASSVTAMPRTEGGAVATWINLGLLGLLLVGLLLSLWTRRSASRPSLGPGA